MDRDVRRYAIQKAMRAIDLGAELGAQLHGLSSGREAAESVAAKTAVGRPRSLPRGDRLPVRIRHASSAIRRGSPCESMRHEASERLLPVDGRARTGVHRDARASRDGGARPREVQGRRAGWVPRRRPGDRRGQAAPHRARHPARRRRTGPVLRRDKRARCLLPRQAARGSGYGGPLHFDVDRYCVGDSDEIWDFAVGCMRTYSAFVAKARRFDDDPEIRDALADAARSSWPSQRRAVLGRCRAGAVGRAVRPTHDGRAPLSTRGSTNWSSTSSSAFADLA